MNEVEIVWKVLTQASPPVCVILYLLLRDERAERKAMSASFNALLERSVAAMTTTGDAIKSFTALLESKKR